MEGLTLAVAAAVALVVATLDLTGVLDQVEWVRGRVPVLTLLVAGAACGHLAVRHVVFRRELDGALDEAVQRIRTSLGAVEFRRFDDAGDYWLYASQRIRAAESSIDDFSCGFVAMSQVSKHTSLAYQTFRRSILSACTGKGRQSRLVYREVTSFPNDRRITRVRELLDERYPNYHSRYYDFDHDSMPPMFHFFVIDGTEILFNVHSRTATGSDNKRVAIRDDRLAEVISHFFELAWRAGLVLKDVNDTRPQVLDELRLRFGDPGQK